MGQQQLPEDDKTNKTNKTMTNFKTMAVVIGLAASTAVSQAAVSIDALTINLSSDGDIYFIGKGNGASTFSFFLGGNFHVTSSYQNYDPFTPGDSYGDTGNFSTGPFLIGAMTGVNTAPVSGDADLYIKGVAGDLTGKVKWGAITTEGTSSISGKVQNFNINWNVVGLSYSGLMGIGNPNDQDLQYYAKAKEASLVLTFQFSSQGGKDQTLTGLVANGAKNATSYSVTMTAVPEPSTYIAGLGALCLFGFTAIPKRKK